MTHHPLFYFDEDVWNFSVSFFLSFEGFFVRVRAVVFQGFFVTRSVVRCRTGRRRRRRRSGRNSVIRLKRREPLREEEDGIRKHAGKSGCDGVCRYVVTLCLFFSLVFSVFCFSTKGEWNCRPDIPGACSRAFGAPLRFFFLQHVTICQTLGGMFDEFVLFCVNASGSFLDCCKTFCVLICFVIRGLFGLQ